MSALFVARGRFRPSRLSLVRERVMREPLLPAIPAARGAQHAPFDVDPFGGIYTHVCTYAHTRARGSRICTARCTRTRAPILAHSRQRTRIAVYTTTEYCIMQPLIAVLSFTHAICCSRCNPCPVTASSVQSPSR